MYFNLSIPKQSDIATYKDGLILLQYMKNEEYRQEKQKTKFGKLVSGTMYEQYAIFNQDTHLSDAFIEKKKGTAHFDFAFIYNNMTFGVWVDYNER